ncbi:MAG: hypothetical protein V4591_00525 [Bdellovibrionota bacterium]
MSELYNKLKYNVDKVNSLYKNGITFHNNKTWVAPLDGSISIEGLGKSLQAKDYTLGHVGYAVFRSSVMSSGITAIDNLCGTYGTKYAVIGTGKENVKKFSAYEIGVGDNAIFNNKTYSWQRADSNSLNVTPGPDEYGHYAHFVGQVFHVEGKDQTNPSFMGDCDLTITDSQVTWDYSQPIATKITTYTYNISKIYRQPSQATGKIIPPYLKIKYSEDVLSIFSDNYS